MLHPHCIYTPSSPFSPHVPFLPLSGHTHSALSNIRTFPSHFHYFVFILFLFYFLLSATSAASMNMGVWLSVEAWESHDGYRAETLVLQDAISFQSVLQF